MIFSHVIADITILTLSVQLYSVSLVLRLSDTLDLNTLVLKTLLCLCCKSLV